MSTNGMKRLLVKSTFGVGRDFSVYEDESATNKVFDIDAKMGLGSKANISDANGTVLYTAKGRIINIPRKMDFLTPSGEKAAQIVAHFSPIKSRLTMTLADGRKWELSGNFIGKNYTVVEGNKTIIAIDQQWLTVRDKYFVDIAEDVDIALALGLIWTVDIWREDKNN